MSEPKRRKSFFIHIEGMEILVQLDANMETLFALVAILGVAQPT
jgi:hypothetical protein